MRWIIRVKHEANHEEIGALLARTADKPIVEISTRGRLLGRQATGQHPSRQQRPRPPLDGAPRAHPKPTTPQPLSSHWLDRIDIGALARGSSLSQQASTEQSASLASTRPSPAGHHPSPASPGCRPGRPAPARRQSPTIYNLKHNPDAEQNGAIRIDRQTEWGNPFKIGEHGSRDEVIVLYQKDLWTRIRSGEISLTALAELNGKDLACHCSPKACHGDVLSRAATWAAAQLELNTEQHIPIAHSDHQHHEPSRQSATAADQNQATTSLITADRTHDPATASTHAQPPSPSSSGTDLPQSPLSDLKQLLNAAKIQNSQAQSVRVDSVLIPGHEALASAAQQYIHEANTTTLSPTENMNLDNLIQNQQRHNDCIVEINNVCARIEGSLKKHSDLEYLANGNDIDITMLDSYDDWITNARELSEHGQNMIAENEVFDSALHARHLDQPERTTIHTRYGHRQRKLASHQQRPLPSAHFLRSFHFKRTTGTSHCISRAPTRLA